MNTQTEIIAKVSRSEYLSVIIALIVGLALTRILLCVSTALPKRKDDVWSMPHSVLMIAAFILQVNYWWNLYGAEELNRVSFWGFVFVLMVPVLMYVATTSFIPDFHRSKPTTVYDYAEFLRQRSRMFYRFVMAVLIMMVLQGIFIWGDDIMADDKRLIYMIRGGVIAVIFICHWFRHSVVQHFLAFFLLIAMIAYTLIGTDGFEWPSLFREGMAGAQQS